MQETGHRLCWITQRRIERSRSQRQVLPIDQALWPTIQNQKETTILENQWYVLLWFLGFYTHYSKSQIFVQKFNFDKTAIFSKSFSSKIFLTIFLVKSKLSTAKKPKTTTFSRVFHPKNRQFSQEIKVEFLDKNEDFEQCVTQEWMLKGPHFGWWK